MSTWKGRGREGEGKKLKTSVLAEYESYPKRRVSIMVLCVYPEKRKRKEFFVFFKSLACFTRIRN